MAIRNQPDFLDTPPNGYTRRGAKKGWLKQTPSPQRKAIKKLKDENAALRERLDLLEHHMEKLIKAKDQVDA